MTEKQESDQSQREILGQSDTTHRGFLAKATELGFSKEEIENLRSIYRTNWRRTIK